MYECLIAEPPLPKKGHNKPSPVGEGVEAVALKYLYFAAETDEVVKDQTFFCK